ncbi:uncharacterized protein K444DRAFT_634500 [Hyaloscypha bicolor E]|uniref:Uncharacterized protein n=1 Tax=Hyaloscypha bicolor E TaxID=1095630 RepID=A0A2J6SUA4_9HELO|nr:uncharacterized protein K444DRAFT_634500 [Hyaloscypha bicolor E]PMD54339.1 hypothetical protein K444DRAFT_634500 [Hyaloscypha bicolor E]
MDTSKRPPDKFNRNNGAERIALRRMLSIACDHRDAAVNGEARAKAEGLQVGHEPRPTAEVGPCRNTNPIDLTTSPSSSFSRSSSSSSKSMSKRRGTGSSGGSNGSQCSERARRSLTVSLHGFSDSGSDCRRGRGSSGDSESAYVRECAPEMMWLDDEEGLEAMAYEARPKAQAGRNRTLESIAIMEDGRGQAKHSVQPTMTTSNQVMRPLVGVVIHAQTRKTLHNEGKSFGPRFDEKGRYKAKEQPRPSSSKLPVNLDDLPTMNFSETNLDPFFGLTIPRESPPREAGHTKRTDHGK